LGTLQSRDYPPNFVRTGTRSIADLTVAISKPDDKSSRKLTTPELAFMLSCVQTALQGAEVNRGIVPVADIEKDGQDLLKAFVGQVDAALKVINSPNVPDEQLDSAVNTLGQEVAKLVPAGASPATPPAAATPASPPTPPAAAAPDGSSAPKAAGPRTTTTNRPTGTVGVKE
jgi:hypothetical protein